MGTSALLKVTTCKKALPHLKFSIYLTGRHSLATIAVPQSEDIFINLAI